MMKTAPVLSKRVNEFVLGFFPFLEEKKTPFVLLHEWRSGGKDLESDVDLCVDSELLPSISRLVDEYCRRNGWLLCQVLWHETTAAYCVCSDAGEPRRSVAFDVCSDYRRNGVLLIGVGEFLENRVRATTGVWRLSKEMEFLYRIVKAGVKRKDPGRMAEYASSVAGSTRRLCEEWLARRWGIEVREWNGSGLGVALKELERRTRRSVRSFGWRPMSRVLRRVLRPTGLVVVCRGEEEARVVIDVFGKTYFRRAMICRSFPWNGWFLIVKSTLIVVAEEKRVFRRFFGSDLFVELHGEHCLESIAGYLHRRCVSREGIGNS